MQHLYKKHAPRRVHVKIIFDLVKISLRNDRLQRFEGF